MSSKEEYQSQILNLIESETNFATFYDQTEQQILSKDKNLIKVAVNIAGQVLDSPQAEPISKFLILLLIQKSLVKKCIELIQEAHSNSTFLKALEKIAKHEKNSANPNRGASMFPKDPEVGQNLLILTLEFIVKTASMFASDSNKNQTKFAALYTRCLDEGVTFPSEPFMFFETKKKKKQGSSSQFQQQQQTSSRGGGGGTDDMSQKTATGNNNSKQQKNSSNIAQKITEDVQTSVSTLVNIFNATEDIDQDIKDEIEVQAKRFKKYNNQLTQMLESESDFDEELMMKMFQFQDFLNQFCVQVQQAQTLGFNDNAAQGFKNWLLRTELPFVLDGQEYEEQQNQGYQQQQQQQQKQQSQSQIPKQQDANKNKDKQRQRTDQTEQEEQKFDQEFQQNMPSNLNNNNNFNDPFNQFSSNQNPNNNFNNNNNNNNKGNDDDLFGTFTNQQMKDIQNKNQGQNQFNSNFDEFNFGGGSNVQQNNFDDGFQQQERMQQEELDRQLKKQKELELQQQQEYEKIRLQQAEQLRREAEEKKRLKEQKEQEDKLRREREEQQLEQDRLREQQEKKKKEQLLLQQQILEQEKIEKQIKYEQEQERIRIAKLQEEENLKIQQQQQLLLQKQQQEQEQLQEQERLKQLRLQEQQQLEYERLQKQQYDEEQKVVNQLYNDNNNNNNNNNNNFNNSKTNNYFNNNDTYDRGSFGIQNKGYFYDQQNSNIHNNESENNNKNGRPPAGPSQNQIKQNQITDPKMSKIELAFTTSQNQKFSFAPEQKNSGRNNLLNANANNEDNRTEMSFNEQFSVSNVSAMGGGYAVHDFPLKHIKLLDNKIYKGTEVQLTNDIDKILKSYNYSPQNIRRFRLSNLKKKNNLFENSYIQIGTISDLIFDYIPSQNYLKLTVFVGNKTRQPIRNVKIEFDGDESSYVYLKQEKNIDLIPAKTQERFEIIVGYKDIPISLVNMDLTADFGEIEESQTMEFSIFMPNLLSKYIQFKDLDAYVFRTKWKEYSKNIQRTDIFQVSKQIIKTPAYFRRYFTKILEISTSLEQFVLQQSSNQYDIKYYKLGALIELHDSESEFLIKFNVRPDNTLCIQIISLNDVYQSTAANLLQHLRYLFQNSL